MVKKISYGLVVIILAVLFLGVASASFSFTGESLRRSYAVGENIAGKIVIAVDNEPGESMIEGDFDGGMALFDLIKANNLSKSAYNCSTLQCAPKLTASGGAINSISIGNDEKIIGFKINGEDVTIQSVYLSVQGGAGQSCNEPLRADILGNGEWIVGSSGYGLPCGLKNYGCFDSALDSGSYENANLGYSGLCNEVDLPDAPAYELGAKVQLGTGSVIHAELWDMNDNVLDSCELALGGSAGSVQEASCVVNYSITESGKYKVCVKASNEPSGYKVKSETSGDKCGTGGRDYEVFARGMAYAANPKIVIDGAEDGNIIDYVQSYIYSNYLGDCSDGCIVPFKISGMAQQATLSGKIGYYPGNIESSNIYAIGEEMPEINSKRLELDVKYANLSVGDEGKMNYSLYLDGDIITKIPINVLETFSFDITPKYAPLGAAVKFSALTDENITTSTWNFGDGNTGTFYGKDATHVFGAEGEYTIGVDLVSSDGLRAAKTFVIQTGSAESAVISLTDKYSKRIANLTAKLSSYPTWIGDALKTSVDITAMGAAVEKAKEDFGGNVSASTIVGSLVNLRVPYAIATSKRADYPLAKGYSGIDANLAGQFYGRDIGDAEAMRQGIVNWIGKNYDINIAIESISRYDDDGNSVILNHYTLRLTPKGNAQDATLFINYPLNAIKFAGSYGQREVGDGTAIPLSGQNTIEFAILNSVDMSSLGIYLSPDVSGIQAVSVGPISQALAPYFEFNSVLFWLGLLVLLVLFLIAYIMLQEWLKKNTEKGLFPNPDELYNVVTFIHNSRRKAMGDGEIRKNLEKSGWRKQQIDYAFDRIEGKRAMFEIPIFRAAEQKKIRDEIAKRSGGPAGLKAESARFIKR